MSNSANATGLEVLTAQVKEQGEALARLGEDGEVFGPLIVELERDHGDAK
jgi:hypothetical protein